MFADLTQKIHLVTDPQALSVEDALTAPRLIRKSFEAPLVLKGSPFFVGRDESAVNLVIPSTFVSRRHAVFIKQDQDYFVQDLHSKNGTYINGERLESGTLSEHPLKDGDRIRFNIIEFSFVNPKESINA